MKKDDDKSMMSVMLKEEAFFMKQRTENMHTFILDDDQDQLLEKLLNLPRLNPLDRENYTKHLSYCIRSLGQKGIDNLQIIFEKYKQQEERYQLMMIEQTSLIYDLIPLDQIAACSTVITILSYFLLHSPLRLKEQAGQQLVKIALHLHGDDKGNQILPIIIKMAHDDNNEENRQVALQLMGKLCKMFGQQLCESFIAFEVLSLGEDGKQMVRKEAMVQLPFVSKVVGKDFFNKKLFPLYMKKCKEKTSNVRQACIDNFLAISDLSTMQQRQHELTVQLLSFQQDSNKDVKGVAYRCLARFIASIDSDKLEPKLFENYMKMTDSDVKDLLPEFQVMFACAYSYPAVLQTVGETKWPQMLKLFNNLWKSKDTRVRKTLAASLHEVAKIIGAKQTEKDLFPVLENIFVKEPDDSVLMGCVRNLSQFLKIFSDDKKEQLLEIFFFIQKDQKKWRIREQIANQLNDMATIFPPETVFKMIIPISFKLCTDSVACIRKIAANQIYSLFKAVEGTEFKMCLIENMIGFQKSQVFYQRQGFAQMCLNIMQLPDKTFENYFKDPLLELAGDKVLNVRFVVAKVLQEHINQKGRLSQNEDLKEVLKILTNDVALAKLLKDQPIDLSSFESGEAIQQQEEEVGMINTVEEVDDEEIPSRTITHVQQPQQQQQQQQQYQYQQVDDEQSESDQQQSSDEQVTIEQEITQIDSSSQEQSESIESSHQEDIKEEEQIQQAAIQEEPTEEQQDKLNDDYVQNTQEQEELIKEQEQEEQPAGKDEQ